MTNCAGRLCYTHSMNIIYIDRLFLLELITDYLLLLLSARVCAMVLKRLRYLAAALFGAAYSVSVFIPPLGFLAGGIWKLTAGLVMGLIAYGGESHPIRSTAVFLAVSSTLGGAVWALCLADGGAFIDFRVLIVCFALCYALLTVISRCRAKLSGKRHLNVELGFLGRQVSFTALADSGNCLSDPLTGAGVLIVSPGVLKDVFADAAPLLEITDSVELLETAGAYPRLSGRLRLIPYSALGGSGMLPVFRPDSLTVDGKDRDDLLCAISASARGDGFDAVVDG